MPTATYIGFDSAVGGDWPAGKGSAGYFIMSDVDTAIQSLPPSITSVARVGTARTDLGPDTPVPNTGMALPGGASRSPVTWGGGGIDVTLATGAPVLVAAYFRANGAPASQNVLRVWIASPDLTTTYLDVSPSGTQLNLGIWSYVALQGPGVVRIRADGYQRVQGALFNLIGAPGRLLCFESGRSGLVG